MSNDPNAAPEGAGAETAAPSSEPPASDIDGALDLAFEGYDDDDYGIEEDAAEPIEAEAVEEQAKSDQPRDAEGKFKAKDAEDEAEPVAEEPEPPKAEAEPAPDFLNFTPAEKEAWGKADPALRSGVVRRIGEIENGLRQYQQAFEPLRPFAQHLAKTGRTVPGYLNDVATLEQKIMADPAAGVRELLGQIQQLGAQVNIEDVAYRLLEGGDLQGPPRADPQIQALQRQVQEIAQGFQQRDQQTRREQATAAVRAEVAQMKAAGQLPHLDALKDDIAQEARRLPQSLPVTQRLKMAHDAVVERYSRISAQINPPAPTPAPEPAQPRARTPQAANLSISGAPAAGSNPAKRQPAKTPEDAVNRAFDELGL